MNNTKSKFFFITVPKHDQTLHKIAKKVRLRLKENHKQYIPFLSIFV